jgi:hypothetical protein
MASAVPSGSSCDGETDADATRSSPAARNARGRRRVLGPDHEAHDRCSGVRKRTQHVVEERPPMGIIALTP